MHAGEENAAWYAIRTRSRHEKLVNQQLVSRDIEVFLPLVTRRQRWADRWMKVSSPLFPGYCFARFPYERRLAVVMAVGFVTILGASGDPIPVPNSEDEAVPPLGSTTLPPD